MDKLKIFICIGSLLVSCQKSQDIQQNNNQLNGPLFGFLITTVGQVYKTSDAGVNWNSVGDAFGGDYNGISLDFIDSNTGFVVTTVGQVYKTSDAGVNWNSVGDAFGGDYNGIDVFF